jgi:hypothetical protein
MDPIGGAASVLILLQVAIVVARTARAICSQLHKVPAELQDLRRKLETIETKLHCVQYASDPGTDSHLPEGLRSKIDRALAQARKDTEYLLSIVQNHDAFTKKLKWLYNGRSRASHTLEILNNACQELEFYMLPLLWARVSEVLQVSRTQPQKHHDMDMRPRLISDGAALRKSSKKRYISTVRRLAETAWIIWVARGSIAVTTHESSQEYSIDAQVLLPLPQIFGPHVLRALLSVRTHPLSSLWTSSFHASYFAVGRLVDSEDPFMKACATGDIGTVRVML